MARAIVGLFAIAELDFQPLRPHTLRDRLHGGDLAAQVCLCCSSLTISEITVT